MWKLNLQRSFIQYQIVFLNQIAKHCFYHIYDELKPINKHKVSECCERCENIQYINKSTKLALPQNRGLQSAKNPEPACKLIARIIFFAPHEIFT